MPTNEREIVCTFPELYAPSASFGVTTVCVCVCVNRSDKLNPTILQSEETLSRNFETLSKSSRNESILLFSLCFAKYTLRDLDSRSFKVTGFSRAAY